MEEAEINFSAAKIMEPIYRMQKIVEAQNSIDAKTLLALCVQYITENYQGQSLSHKDIQTIIQRALLHYKNGLYYIDYLSNELQVKVAGWLTLLACDRPVTLEVLSQVLEEFYEGLSQYNALELTVNNVFDLVKNLTLTMDSLVYERLLLNEDNFLLELETIIL